MAQKTVNLLDRVRFPALDLRKGDCMGYEVRSDGVYEVDEVESKVEPTYYWFGGNLGYYVQISNRRPSIKIISNEDLEKLESAVIVKVLKRYEKENGECK